MRVLVLKQNAPQYNQVLRGIRDQLKHDVRTTFEIDTFEVAQGRAAQAPFTSEVNYDLIVSIGTRSFEVATRNFPKKPHIYGMVINVDSTRIEEVAKASGNGIMGVSLLGKPSAYIDYARKIQKNLKTIGVIYGDDKFNPYLAELQTEARNSGIRVITEKVSQKREFIDKFEAVISSGIDSFLIIPDFFVYDPKLLEHVIINTYNRGIPCIAPSESFVNSGALWAFKVIPDDVGTQIAELISTGVLPSDRKIEYYSPSSIAINVTVAENLHLKIPYRVRKSATLIDLRRQNEK